MLKSTTNVFWRRPWRSNHPAFLCQENLTVSVDTTFTGNKNLNFPIYSAYDDAAYSEHLMEIDAHRIKVSIVFTFNEIFRMVTVTSVVSSVILMVASTKVMTGSMLLMVCGSWGWGIERLVSIKLIFLFSYPHCMWYLPNKNIDFGLDIPPVYTSQPKQGLAFCGVHAFVAEDLGVPSSLCLLLIGCPGPGTQKGRNKLGQYKECIQKINSKALFLQNLLTSVQC